MAFSSSPIFHTKIVSSGTDGGTSSSVDTSGANLLICSVSWFSANSPVLTVSDSKGNVWTPLTVRSSTNDSCCLFYAISATVGAGHTFTVSGSGCFASAQITGWSGADTSPFTVENGSDLPDASLISSANPGTVTPAQDGCLIITAIVTSALMSLSITSPFTISDQDPFTQSGGSIGSGADSGNEGGAQAWLVQGSASAVNPTWEFDPPSFTEMAAVIAVFKPASGAGSSYGTSNGLGVASGVGNANAAAAGLAGGTGAEAGVGIAIGGGLGSASGIGTESGIGSIVASAVGFSAGTGASAGIGSLFGTGVGASSGTGAGTGVGGASDLGVGTSAGTGAGTGVGVAFDSGVGASPGTGAAAGIGSVVDTGVGASAGTGAAAGIGSVFDSGAGTSAGTGAAAGIGSAFDSGVGASAGTGAAAAVGSYIATSVGVSLGTGTAEGSDSSYASADGMAHGTGAAQAVSVTTYPLVERTNVLSSGSSRGVDHGPYQQPRVPPTIDCEGQSRQAPQRTSGSGKVGISGLSSQDARVITEGRGELTVAAFGAVRQLSLSRSSVWIKATGRGTSFQKVPTTQANATVTNLATPKRHFPYVELETPHYDGDVMEYDPRIGA